MRENAPVYRDPDSRVWAVTRYRDIMAVSRDPETFSSAGGIRPDTPKMPYMIDLDDPLHKRRRNLVNKGFTVRRVQAREERIREISVDLIEKVKAKGESFDFVKEIAAWLPLILIGDMLGVDPEHYDDLLRWSDDMVGGSGAMTDEAAARADAAFAEYVAYQNGVIEDRKSKPLQSDLVSVLVNAEIEGEKLTDDEILWESLLILIGGDETTRHVISGGMHQLLVHPEARNMLAEDSRKIPVAVEEMLRWVTPIQNMTRTATRDAEVGGQKILEGDKLMLMYPSANRDEQIFEDPDTFDVTRDPNEHIAFGFGAHFCLGASLARLELRVMFEELCARMPQLELDCEKPRLRASNFICGIEQLPVRFS
jgi:cytochrome P450 family 142 subfamily A polypeptide 1